MLALVWLHYFSLMLTSSVDEKALNFLSLMCVDSQPALTMRLLECNAASETRLTKDFLNDEMTKYAR